MRLGLLGMVATSMAAVFACGGVSQAAVPRRVIELVSTTEKDANVLAGTFSPDGERALYRMLGASDGVTWGSQAHLLATRTEAGWKSSLALPDRAAIDQHEVQVWDWAPDLSKLLLRAAPAVGLNPGVLTLYDFDPLTKHLERLSSVESPGLLGTVVSSDDLRHVYATPAESLVPEDLAPEGGLYDLGAERPRFVGYLPDGRAPLCGVVGNQQEFAESGSRRESRWTSVDGRRVFFLTRGNGDCSTDPVNLYVREGGANGRTIAISSPPLSGADTGASFLQATPSGSEVFYTTANALDPRDTNTSTDVYRYVLGQGNSCLTCTANGSPVVANVSGVSVSENGQRVYFHSESDLVPGVPGGELKLYVWRSSSPETVSYVAPSSGTGWLTFDGRVIVILSGHSEFDARTNTDNGGHEQLYRYDERDQSLICITCPRSGPARYDFAINATSTLLIDVWSGRLVTDDGRSIFIRTRHPLVPEDNNGASDIYEWHDGDVGLITDGRTSYSSLREAHLPLGVSADGQDFFFTSFSKLTDAAPDASSHMYDARIGGGFPAPPPARPCVEDACQGPGSPPALPVSATVDFAGVGEGDETEIRVPPKSTPRVRIGRRVVRGSRLTVAIRVSIAGRITLSGNRVRTTRRAVQRAGTYRVTTTLTRRARGVLRRAGRVRVGLSVSFTSTGAAPRRVTTTFTVRAGR